MYLVLAILAYTLVIIGVPIIVVNYLFATIEFAIIKRPIKYWKFYDLLRGLFIGFLAFLLFIVLQVTRTSWVPLIIIVELFLIKDQRLEIRKPTWTIIGVIMGWALLNIRIVSIQ